MFNGSCRRGIVAVRDHGRGRGRELEDLEDGETEVTMRARM